MGKFFKGSMFAAAALFVGSAAMASTVSIGVTDIDGIGDDVAFTITNAVSYTHLTLPTIYSV